MNFCDQIPGPVSFCVSSGKGGVGKTTLAVNLALCLAGDGHQVLLVDGDLGLSNVDILLGLTAKHNIREMLENGGSIADILVHPFENLAVLPAASGVPELVDPQKGQQQLFFQFVSEVAPEFDFLIVDTGAGIGSTVLWLNSLTQNNILVFKNNPASITDGYALMKVLSLRMRKKRFQLVFNRVESESEGLEAFNKLRLVTDRFLKVELAFLAAIPEDESVRDAVRSQSPLVHVAPDSPGARAFHHMADRLADTMMDRI